MNIIPYSPPILFFAVWCFTNFKFALFSTILFLIILARSWPQEFKYYMKIWAYYMIFLSSTLIYLPYFILHPFSYDNFGQILIFWKHSLRIFRIKVDARDVAQTRINGPAVVLANHQSSFDLLSLVHSLPPRTVILAKKEILYMGWFGMSAYLCNTIFVDRFNHHKAIDTMAKVAKIMNDEQVNVLIYPEGTRSMNGSMLPFKKGAFHLAIQAQVPLLPIVSSSYASFLDHVNKRFDSGKIIVRCMPPVETKGLTADNVDELVTKVREDMLKVYLELSEEIMHEYSAYDLDSNPSPSKEVPLETLKSNAGDDGVKVGVDLKVSGDNEGLEKRIGGDGDLKVAANGDKSGDDANSHVKYD